MHLHHPSRLPRLWLMTDERMDHDLLNAVRALPAGAGIVFRHYSLGKRERRALFNAVRTIARKRRLLLVLAGPPALARAWAADGSHGRHRGAFTAPAHDVPERLRAERNDARLVLVSPVFTTRSHPGAPVLGRVRFGALVRGSRCPVVALGGMTRDKAQSLTAFNIHGWAAIDGLSPDQKRKDVPT